MVLIRSFTSHLNFDAPGAPFMNLKAALVLLIFVATPVAGQQLKTRDFKHVSITMKAHGGPSDRVLPAYSVSVDEKGTVTYSGIRGVKVRGERLHSIPVGVVKALVAEFFRIDFFSLQGWYTSKKLPNGLSETIDHANGTTISIDVDGKTKKVYIFYGAPPELIELQHKLYEATQIAQYVGQ
jgi:hypothetical protein